MRATNASAILPQLLDRYQAALASRPDAWPQELSRITYHSMAIEGTSLTLDQTRILIRTSQPLPHQPLIDQWRLLDHHQALEQILTQASQQEPLNRVALQALAATLMRQTGGPVYSLLNQIDTRKGELRLDTTGVSRQVMVAAHKLPAALDELLKNINTRINQLNTPRQVYDLSFDVHFQLLSLHPFGAGNGPMARLLMNYIQHYHYLPLSGIYVNQRSDYLRALEASWHQKTAVPIAGFLHQQLRRWLAEGIDQPVDEPETD